MRHFLVLVAPTISAVVTAFDALTLTLCDAFVRIVTAHVAAASSVGASKELERGRPLAVTRLPAKSPVVLNIVVRCRSLGKAAYTVPVIVVFYEVRVLVSHLDPVRTGLVCLAQCGHLSAPPYPPPNAYGSGPDCELH